VRSGLGNPFPPAKLLGRAYVDAFLPAIHGDSGGCDYKSDLDRGNCPRRADEVSMCLLSALRASEPFTVNLVAILGRELEPADGFARFIGNAHFPNVAL
jgi:hypothetical protein